jgi:outer membrane biosynthesis protein TonB
MRMALSFALLLLACDAREISPPPASPAPPPPPASPPAAAPIAEDTTVTPPPPAATARPDDAATPHGGGIGHAEGFGVIGVIGHDGGPGVGTGARMRSDAGVPLRLLSPSATKNGRLPPEIIQRIVRHHYGAFRTCYEKSLVTSPSLAGRVVVSFTIRTDGTVANAKDAGSRIIQKDVVSCVVDAFAKLVYPQPEGGEVKVVYPIVFAPGD